MSSITRKSKHSDRQLAALATRVGKHLLRRGLSVATAESCTGGWIMKALTDVAGSSQWVREGFVTYSNEAKSRSLGVSKQVLKVHGAVSESVALAMVTGALKRSDAQVAVAVTGIAGPGGAVAGKPVGTVWLAWANKRQGRVRMTVAERHFTGNRETVRRKTVQCAFEGLLEL